MTVQAGDRPCAEEMESNKSSKIKRKRVEDDSEGVKLHHSKRKFNSATEESGGDEQDGGPRIINMLSKKTAPKLKDKSSVPKKEEAVANKSASIKPLSKRKKKKRSKVNNENASKDNDSQNNSQEEEPPKAIKKPKKSKAEKATEQILKSGGTNSAKHIHETPTRNKAIKYLKTWKKSPSNWKFNKCSQIWLIQNAYDVDKMPDKHFDVLLEYFSSIKGGMKDMTQKRAEKVIELEEKWRSLEGTQTIEEIQAELREPRPGEKKYDRAKEIQIMLGENNN